MTGRRPMARSEKVAVVDELTEQFREAEAVVLTEYRGLSVEQLKQLRRSLGDSATNSVVKNTLTKIAAKEAGYGFLEEHLEGPTAIAFVTGEAVDAAKDLRNFAKNNPKLVVKGGVLEGRTL